MRSMYMLAFMLMNWPPALSGARIEAARLAGPFVRRSALWMSLSRKTITAQIGK